jgi:Cof subfamily protein (haloacid dehalogenase superfamily)
LKKLLVCDLDGTLLDQTGRIDEESLAKINRFIREGNDFCVCTGRLDEDIKFVERKLGIRSAYRISQNGSVIRTKEDKIVYQASIKKEYVQKINAIVFGKGMRVEVSDINHRYFPSPRDPDKVAEFVDTSIIKPNLQEFISSENFRPVIYLLFGNAKQFNIVEEEIKSQLGNRVHVTQTSPTSLEIFSSYASKGNAVKAILEQTGYRDFQLYVAGDAESDMSMFNLTKNTFAVGNADLKVRKIASTAVANVGQVIESIQEGLKN